MRENVNWDVENERLNFLNQQLYPTIYEWNGRLPNLRDIFRPVEIDWLLTEDVKNMDKFYDILKEAPIIRFVIRTGYKDEPEVDKDGEPLLRRTTPVHWAARYGKLDSPVIAELFQIFDRFDVNYVDEFGLTHFHVACMSCHVVVVEKFLELGQDPNCASNKTDPSLHLIVSFTDKYNVAELLLKSGANPNLPGWKCGSTALHIAIQSPIDDSMAELLFKFCKDSMQIDAKDKLGRTPLQWAVARLLPSKVDLLLNNGAELTSFVFPTEAHFYDRYESLEYIGSEVKLRVASDALAVLERLERGGYELDRSDALTIMKLFFKLGLFERNRDLYNDPFQLAENLIDLSMIDGFDVIWNVLHREKSVPRICEEATRGFFRRWALEFFLELTHYQLPILCCEKIVEKLENKDLFGVCMAASDLM
ncbi:unnamed protein product [Trichogramma brassicae]|uniref:Uncharacterized protein n=1 Tax=Trichogramma brassicae TaxID=86971 RepID=A0A6H5J1W6_9HYME|nr:unnamed protein product [Trichogramma brassicae]